MINKGDGICFPSNVSTFTTRVANQHQINWPNFHQMCHFSRNQRDGFLSSNSWNQNRIVSPSRVIVSVYFSAVVTKLSRGKSNGRMTTRKSNSVKEHPENIGPIRHEKYWGWTGKNRAINSERTKWNGIARTKTKTERKKGNGVEKNSQQNFFINPLENWRQYRWIDCALGASKTKCWFASE